MSYREKLGLGYHRIYVCLKSWLFNQLPFGSQIFGINVMLRDANQTLFSIF